MATYNRKDRRLIEDWGGVNTAIVIPDGQFRWYDGVTGYNASEVIELVGDGSTTIASLPKRQPNTDGAQTVYGNKTFDGNVTVDGTFNLAFPIGYVYWQFPNKDSPADMGFTGTWANISSTFAGDFFRAEGGEASAFESGEQEDAMLKITGSVGKFAGESALTDSGTGVFTTTPDSAGTGAALNVGNRVHTIQFDSSLSVSPNAAKTDDVETRPVNHTIRLWERTA